MTWLLQPIGDLADRHPAAVHHLAVALTLCGMGFFIAVPVWARVARRRSADRFRAKFLDPAERRRGRRAW